MRAVMGPVIPRLVLTTRLKRTHTPVLTTMCLMMMMEMTILMTWMRIVMMLMKNPIRNKVLLKMAILLLF
eukprot:XP_003886767.1 hypothetical protein EHEL_020285 [Encephalitozoon hellem ATCC 50504]